MSRVIVLALALLLVMLAFPAFAAKPHPVAIYDMAISLQTPVENQTPGGATQPDPNLWVVNPTPCAWDADDRIQVRAKGYLDDAWAHNECAISDHMTHLAAISACVYTRKLPDLEIALTVATADGTVSQHSSDFVRVNKATSCIRVCVKTPEYEKRDLPSLPAIEGSNGGHGAFTDVAYEVRSLQAKRIRQVAVSAVIVNDAPGYRSRYCP